MIRGLMAIIGLSCLMAATGPSSAWAEPRIALVMGNSNYGSEMGKLPNPVNDATLVAQALQQTGFQVTKVTDADWKKMKRAIQEFGDKLASAGPEATALFFYAGHGVQVQGTNYLVPVGADISKEADVGIESISADDVLQQMEFAGSKVNIIVLDACRNNPIGRGLRSATRGLAVMDANVRGTFIAYSTAPGSTAADGNGKNSPYSEALAKTIVQPGVGIEEAFRDVRAQVMAATGEKQIPWDSSSLTAPFFFQPASAQSKAAPATSAPSTLDSEKAIWQEISNSKQASDYQAYLSQYPNGTYAALARSRLSQLKQGSTAAAPVAPPKQPEAPRAAPVATPVAPEPGPKSAPVATEEQPSSLGGSDSNKGPEVDSRGVDCRIMDTTRSQSDCPHTKRFAPANKPNRS